MELILNTYGVSLNRDNEGFVISTSDGKQRIPAVGIDSIQISRGAQITSDAVMLAVEHEIEVMFMDRTDMESEVRQHLHHQERAAELRLFPLRRRLDQGGPAQED